MLNIAVLVSGRGSNLQALIDACELPNFPAKIVHVISNKAEAYGLTRAQEHAIPTTVISHKDYPSREAFDNALHAALEQTGAELVCLAGFMRLLTPAFTEAWRDKLINIHPSLLPAFKGVDAQQQAFDAGVKLSGCTVHFVRPEMDAGPIILQAAVPIHSDDTVEALSERILSAEHHCYPLAVKLIAEGKVNILDNKVFVVGD